MRLLKRALFWVSTPLLVPAAALGGAAMLLWAAVALLHDWSDT